MTGRFWGDLAHRNRSAFPKGPNLEKNQDLEIFKRA